MLRSVACLHTNQSRSYLNHLVHDAKLSANFLTSLFLFILFARLCSFPKSVNNYVFVMEVQCDFYDVLTELINSTSSGM